MEFLSEKLVRLGVEVDHAEEAVKAAGNLLLNENLVEASYIEAMLKAYRENGPYFVLAPQIAIPHARPEDGVKEASVSFVQLKKPVLFGHKDNDPVSLVFALGASTSDEHLAALRKLTTLLNDHKNIEKMMQAKNFNDLQSIL